MSNHASVVVPRTHPINVELEDRARKFLKAIGLTFAQMEALFNNLTLCRRYWAKETRHGYKVQMRLCIFDKDIVRRIKAKFPKRGRRDHDEIMWTKSIRRLAIDGSHVQPIKR